MADSQRKLTILPDNPLCGIITYKDTLDLSNGSVSRYVRKTIMTGTETITTQKEYYRNNTALFVYRGYTTGYSKRGSLNSHFVSITTNPQTNNYESSGFNDASTYSDFYYMRINYSTIGITGDESYADCVNAFKTWLAQQYANGTPVTIYYYVSTPTTETITVPSGLSGTEEGYLNQSGTPTPTNPIYPTANNVEVWLHSLRKLTTATDTITTLPAVVYADGNNATVGLVGNMQQTGTPTPQNPIQPSECGDLETTGTHAGQYKIPILNNSQTTNVYLGEVQTTRQIKKIVFVGSEDENWAAQSAGGGAIRFKYAISNSVQADTAHVTSVCTHLPLGAEGGTWNIDDIYTISSNYLWLRLDGSITTVASLKSWLAQQYSNGTPFTVYYTLATPKTGIVNEPLMKIGEYADEVSGITIPTIAGADSFDVLTTLKPSEVTANYHGWHTGAVHERDSGQWD